MARKTSRKANADCPECNRTLYFEIPPNLGQKIFCPICDAALEVIHDYPLVLDWAVDHNLNEFYEDEEEDLVYSYDEYLDYDDYGDEIKAEYRGGQNGHEPDDTSLDD
jgi:hypothetical protein